MRGMSPTVEQAGNALRRELAYWDSEQSKLIEGSIQLVPGDDYADEVAERIEACRTALKRKGADS